VKIKKLSIRGFRSLKDVTWEPGDLNVLIGPNASGKSNLLRGIELLAEAMSGNLDDTLVQKGGIATLLWDSRARRIEWEMRLSPDHLLNEMEDAKELRYELCLQPFGLQGAFTNRFRVEREILKSYNQGSSSQDEALTFIDRSPDKVIIRDNGRGHSTAPAELKETETVVSQASVLSLMITFVKSHMSKWRVHQDLSIYQDSPTRRAAITRRETQLAAEGQNLVNVMHTLYSTDKNFKTAVNDAMVAAFGREFEGLEFTPAEDQRIQMRLRWKSLKTLQSTADLSDGTLRFLMLLAVLLNQWRGNLVAIDEPETGLHPSMFPIIAELAADAARSSQIVFTTHSPEFLTALGEQNATTTVVQNEEGETKLSVLNGEDLKKWLEKYKLGQLFLAGDLEALA
jgi:predicted ATPase